MTRRRAIVIHGPVGWGRDRTGDLGSPGRGHVKDTFVFSQVVLAWAEVAWAEVAVAQLDGQGS